MVDNVAQHKLNAYAQIETCRTKIMELPEGEESLRQQYLAEIDNLVNRLQQS